MAFFQVKRRQMHYVAPHAIVHKMVLELMRSNKDSFEGSKLPVKNEDELLQTMLASGRSHLANQIYVCRMIVAFFFKKYDKAEEMAKKLCDYRKQLIVRIVRIRDVYGLFFQGLVAFRLSRSKEDEPEWMSFGEEAVVTFQSWAKHSEWNFENKLLLLQAECHFSKGDGEAAERKYKLAIKSARKHRFLHEEGLAMDLLGLFYKSCGKTKEESESFESARACYKKWGAHGILECS